MRGRDGTKLKESLTDLVEPRGCEVDTHLTPGEILDFFSCLLVLDSVARVMDEIDEAFSCLCVYVCCLNILYPILFHEL